MRKRARGSHVYKSPQSCFAAPGQFASVDRMARRPRHRVQNSRQLSLVEAVFVRGGNGINHHRPNRIPVQSRSRSQTPAGDFRIAAHANFRRGGAARSHLMSPPPRPHPQSFGRRAGAQPPALANRSEAPRFFAAPMGKTFKKKPVMRINQPRQDNLTRHVDYSSVTSLSEIFQSPRRAHLTDDISVDQHGAIRNNAEI